MGKVTNVEVKLTLSRYLDTNALIRLARRIPSKKYRNTK